MIKPRYFWFLLCLPSLVKSAGYDKISYYGPTQSSRFTTANVEQRFQERCAKYAEYVFELRPDPVLLPGATPKKRDTCAISSQPTIVGGELASPREFPHMALIGYGDYPIKWRCAGSLISELWVISAAHCTVTPDNLVAKYVLLGDLDVLSSSDDQKGMAKPQIFQIVAHRNHPKYRRPLVYNDISLYKMNQTVVFNRFIRPICLHAKISAYNQTALASGWGDTSYTFFCFLISKMILKRPTVAKALDQIRGIPRGYNSRVLGPIKVVEGNSSSHLLKVGLDIVDNEQCNNAYPQTDHSVRRYLRAGINESVQVCAWASGKDTCQGDSGGPLQQALKTPYCMYTLIGLTSVGNKCSAGAPGVYTRVSHYLTWIESIAFPEGRADETTKPTFTASNYTG